VWLDKTGITATINAQIMQRQLLPCKQKKEREIGRQVKLYLGKAPTEIIPTKRYYLFL